MDGFFYNPNIQPFREHQLRRQGAFALAGATGRRCLAPEGYDMPEFLRRVVSREQERCLLCYRMRLMRTAAFAAREGYDAFTSTLLLSIHQDHELVRRTGKAAAREAGVEFLYRDYRPDWKLHWELTDRYGLYKQSWCGCVFSEYERYGSRR